MTFIEGLSLGGYRSFGDEAQRMGPFQQVNLFAGPNNCGKSNILLFLTRHLAWALQWAKQKGVNSKFDNLDVHRGTGARRFTFGLGTVDFDNRFDDLRSSNPKAAEYLKALKNSRTLAHCLGLAWFEYSADSPGATLRPSPEIITQLLAEDVLNHNQWNVLWQAVCNQTGGLINSHWIPQTLTTISPVQCTYPNVSFIPAIREIGATERKEHVYSGAGIIDELKKLEKPTYDNQEDKQRFEKINHFLRTVTQNKTATLDIPHDSSTITVHMDGKSLPIQSLGTGIHEVIILAAAATIHEDQIICMEEPEIHLHPILQRHLLEYLAVNTTNQYFIATHSAHLLDAPDTAIFRVSLEDGQTRVRLAQTAADKFSICQELGYRASDLLQSNAVIWVEGPSDRIYLNHWINAVDAGLIEGLHYSIMFYGGRLLSHLSVNDPEIDDFISLRRMNRNLVVVMDSDRSSVGKRINETKKRIRQEFDDGPGFAWVTHGREIENYVDTTTLREAVEAVMETAGKRVLSGRFDSAIPRVNPRKKNSPRIDKIKIAHEVANRPPNLDVLDLHKRLKQLVQFIHTANA